MIRNVMNFILDAPPSFWVWVFFGVAGFMVRRRLDAKAREARIQREQQEARG
jgi:hypothetical protein